MRRSDPRAAVESPGITSMEYGVPDASRKGETTNGRLVRREVGPSSRAATANAVSPASTPPERCMDGRSILFPPPTAASCSTARATTRWISTGESPVASLDVIAPSTAPSSEGSCSSRYSATCRSVIRRLSGHSTNRTNRTATVPQRSVRNAISAAGENRKWSAPHAAITAASTPPTPTIAKPWSSTRRRHRRRAARITATSSSLMGCPSSRRSEGL